MGLRVLETPYQELDGVMALDGGWTIFHFFSKGDRNTIEKRYWVISSGSLFLERWHVGFDPRSEVLHKRNLWILLQGFPVHRWNIKGFMGVANAIGKLILMEEEQLLGFSHCTPGCWSKWRCLMDFPKTLRCRGKVVLSSRG